MTPKERARFGVGLSPRGRRHRLRIKIGPPGGGSISAWAEAPARAAPPGAHLRVYLRVGGGTQAQRRVGHRVQGLSPRGRRHRNCGAFRGHLARSISAWAEAPAFCLCSISRMQVYLRVGGGTPLSFCHGPPGNRAIHRDRGSFPVRTSQVSLLFAHGSTPVLFGPAPTTPASAAPHPRAWRSPDGR